MRILSAGMLPVFLMIILSEKELSSLPLTIDVMGNHSLSRRRNLKEGDYIIEINLVKHEGN